MNLWHMSLSGLCTLTLFTKESTCPKDQGCPEQSEALIVVWIKFGHAEFFSLEYKKVDFEALNY